MVYYFRLVGMIIHQMSDVLGKKLEVPACLLS
jgi:hypothetical protein